MFLVVTHECGRDMQWDDERAQPRGLRRIANKKSVELVHKVRDLERSATALEP